MSRPPWDLVRRGRRFPGRRPGAPPFYPRPQWGSNEGWRCGECWHRTATHWYARTDPRFQGHPGTRWCQMCGEYCSVASCLSAKAVAAKVRLERSVGLHAHEYQGSEGHRTGSDTSPPDSRAEGESADL
jgi:hypothetical protein